MLHLLVQFLQNLNALCLERMLGLIGILSLTEADRCARVATCGVDHLTTSRKDEAGVGRDFGTFQGCIHCLAWVVSETIP